MTIWRKYWWVGLTSARANLAYLSDLIGRLAFLAVILYIFLRLWQATYSHVGAAKLGGLTLEQMLWYLAVTEAIFMSAPRVAQTTDEDVRTGALAVQLLRPISYPLYRLAATLGERYVRFAINLAVGSAIAVVLVGAPSGLAQGLVALAVTLPMAFLLDFLGNFWVGLGAFWLEDTSGLLLLYSRAAMLLGGVLLPIELYPTWAQPLLRWLPFANVASGPARALVAPDWHDLPLLLLRQSCCALVFGLGVWLTYRLAVRRVFVNGG